MPAGNQTVKQKSLPKNNPKKRKKRRRPLIRFRFSTLITLWILSLILCFGMYMFQRNFHPERDVFIKGESSSEEPLETEPGTLPAETEPDFQQSAATDNGTPEESSQAPQEAQKVYPLPESPRKGEEYLQTVAVIGESNIYQMGVDGLLQPLNVYASETLNLDNYTTEYVLLDGTTIRILSAINSASCPIYLMFGTESLTEQAPGQAADKFSILLNQVKAAAPEAEIFVMSIPPVTASAEGTEKPILNSDIDDYNSLLLTAAKEANVYFIDTNTALKAMDGKDAGKLRPEYAREDGIHLNAEGEKALLEYILTHVPAMN